MEEKKKKDAKELVTMLDSLPKEKRDLVSAVVAGYVEGVAMALRIGQGDAAMNVHTVLEDKAVSA